MSNPSIAFIGTGIMGLPMCRQLLENGYAVTAWNRTHDKMKSLEAKGAVIAESAANAAGNADVVILMLSSGPVVTEVLFGDSGAAEQLKPNATVVVMSSIPVETSRAHAALLQERRVHYVDAPVSGGERGAIDASLTIMAGGKKASIDRVTDVLAAMGRVTHVGPVGCGQLAKLANQTIVGITIGAVAEALLLVQAGGADMAAVREALIGGFADSTILRQHGERMIHGNFEPGAKSEVQLKDLRTSRELAESFDLDLPVLRLAESLYQEMCDSGRKDIDHSGLFLHLSTRGR